ncbi:MAG: hypothetical protein ACYDCJ_04285 [Gammaproteobacteria bacterium]
MLLFLGIAIGIAVLATGYVKSQYLSAQVNDLISECKAENQKLMPPETPPWAKDAGVCDLQELEASRIDSSNGLEGIQAKIVDTHMLAESWLTKSLVFSVVFVCIFAIPYAWYFLLRRIRELREAFIGK